MEHLYRIAIPMLGILVITCSEPDRSPGNESNSMIASLITRESYPSDTLSIETVLIPDLQSIDLSEMYNFEYDFIEETHFDFDGHFVSVGSTKDVHIVIYFQDRNSIGTHDLYSFGGWTTSVGLPFGKVKFFIFSVLGQASGSAEIIFKHGMSRNELYGSDTLLVDLGLSNISIPFDTPNLVPSLVDVPIGKSYTYELDFRRGMRVIDNRMEKPMGVFKRWRDGISIESRVYPQISNYSTHFDWSSRFVFQDSISVFQIHGILDETEL